MKLKYLVTAGLVVSLLGVTAGTTAAPLSKTLISRRLAEIGVAGPMFALDQDTAGQALENRILERLMQLSDEQIDGAITLVDKVIEANTSFQTEAAELLEAERSAILNGEQEALKTVRQKLAALQDKRRDQLQGLAKRLMGSSLFGGEAQLQQRDGKERVLAKEPEGQQLPGMMWWQGERGAIMQMVPMGPQQMRAHRMMPKQMRPPIRSQAQGMMGRQRIQTTLSKLGSGDALARLAGLLREVKEAKSGIVNSSVVE